MSYCYKCGGSYLRSESKAKEPKYFCDKYCEERYNENYKKWNKETTCTKCKKRCVERVTKHRSFWSGMFIFDNFTWRYWCGGCDRLQGEKHYISMGSGSDNPEGIFGHNLNWYFANNKLSVFNFIIIVFVITIFTLFFISRVFGG